MGGEIWLESEEGTGTTFHFTATFGWRPEPSPDATQQRLRRLRGRAVLIVDDNQTNLRILSEMLLSWHLQVTSVTSAAAALEALQQAAVQSCPFSACLTDCHMPELDGFGLVEKIRQDRQLQDMVVLMLTSGLQPEDSERARRLGIAAQLLKPVRQSRLLKYLDAAVAGELPLHAAEELHPTTFPAKLPPLQVLVAEDGLVNQKFVRALLAKQGHHVSVVNNGQLAVDRCLSDSPDVILMDIQMPVMDGIQATGQIRAAEQTTGRHTPIVAMTAHAMKGDRERCLQAGMDQYVSKPLRAHQLFEAIAAALGQAAAAVVAPEVPLTTTESITPTTPAAPEATVATVANWPDALEAVNGDWETLQGVIEAHLQESPRLLGELRNAMAAGDAVSVQRAAHTLKSSLRFFGAVHAADLAWQLEQAGKGQDLVAAESLLQQLAEQMEQVDRVIAAGPPA